MFQNYQIRAEKTKQCEKCGGRRARRIVRVREGVGRDARNEGQKRKREGLKG
jgi:hypothetical protein